MIKNIIFDMGGVLIEFDKQHFLDNAKVFDINDRKLLINEIFNSLEWSMMDRGTIDEKKCYKIVIQRLPKRLHSAAYQLIFKWDDPLVQVEGMYELIMQLYKNGYNLYLLSNATSRLKKEYWNRIKGYECFNGLVISADIHLLKPNKDIYEFLLQKYDLLPEECLFIDDLPINVEGASQCGVKGIVFHNDIKELKDKLNIILNR